MDRLNINSNIQKLDGEITGNIQSVLNLTGELSNALVLSGKLSPSSIPLYPMYDGVYEVTPVPELDIVLDTRKKLLTQDVIVNSIPYYEATNDSGGYTVTIG